MKLRTELQKIHYVIQDAAVVIQELSTSIMTEIAMLALKDRAASLKPTFINAVKEWENIFDENGQPLECNDENKEKVFEANREFAEEIVKQLPSLNLFEEEEKKI